MQTGPEIKRVGEVHVIQLEPRYENLDEVTLDRARQAWSEVTEQMDSEPLVVIDMEHTTFFGSPVVGLLFQMRHEVVERGGRFALCNTKEFCEDVLRVVKFDKVCEIFESLDQAVAALAES